jgi:hypothetical protein
MHDRRRHPRFAVASAARFFLGVDKTELRARLVDLSPHGMRIEIPNVRIADDLLLQIRLARTDGRGATAIGRVARADDHAIAFRFDAVWADDQGKLASTDLWETDDTESINVMVNTPRWWQFWGPPVSVQRAA